MKERIKKMKTIYLRILLATSLVIMASSFYLLASCGGDDDDDNDNNSGETAPFSLYMIDAPVDEADAIYLTVNEVAVHTVASAEADDDDDNNDNDAADDDTDGTSAKAQEGSWITLAVEPARYNLLELQNNAGVVLAEQNLAAGDYNQIRLIIECEGEEAPEIVIEGESHPLKVPSGCTSGFKLNGQFTIAAGQETVLIMDFDMRKSVHETGNGKYMLNPVVRFIQADAAGNISGEVTPIVPRTAVYAFENDAFTGENFEEAVNSTIIDEATGAFTLAALPAGTYDLVVAATGYETLIYVEDAVVEAGEDTTLENPIELILDE